MSIVEHHSAPTVPEIVCSEQAKKHFVSYLEQHPQYCGVRFSVKKTGCSGLSYVVDYVSEPSEADLQITLSENYLICVDPKAYPFLKNMQVDYVKQGLNSKLVFSNPNQTGQCGCGESFTVES